ncbi:kinase-like protein [Calocera viscosa TUFC12733]|uniref:Kinase-like protein n=1 Tax=Calocera viscosa (strain TUFC12733) TaxID=1330018 RepID=A0A167N8X3_CALVF|nr:kinase-like protein [Calocera viscosa TUFC12733]
MVPVLFAVDASRGRWTYVFRDGQPLSVPNRVAKCSYNWSVDDGVFGLFPAWANLNGMLALERGEQQVAIGGFARIYRTRMKTGIVVAVKVLFDHRRPPERLLELSVREGFTWHSLDHPNIVPFLGIADYARICPGGFPQLCLVSPWMSDGNIMDFLKANPAVSPLPLMLDVVHAVAYLHSFSSGPIIHGDLKGNNILIDCQGSPERPVARLIDFGLSEIMEVDMEHEAATATSTTSCGNVRWLSFERVDPKRYGLKPSEAKTTMSDVFELTRTFFQIFTGGPPFQEMQDWAVVTAVLRGSNPERPIDCRWLDDDRWKLMMQLWSDVREARPSLDALRQDLEQSIWIENVLRSNTLVDLGVLLRGDVLARRLLSQRERINAVEFDLSTGHDWSIQELEWVLSQLDIKKFCFTHAQMGTRQEDIEAVMQLTPSLQHLELRARADLPVLCATPFLQVAQNHASNLTTLIIASIPAAFAQVSSASLINLEIRIHIGERRSNDERLFAFLQLLNKTPSLERLVFNDGTETTALHGANIPPSGSQWMQLYHD